MTTWHAANTGNHQGLIIDEKTGANIAVAYDKADAPLIAAAPELLDGAKLTFEHSETVLRQYDLAMQAQACNGPDAKLMLLANYGEMALMILRQRVAADRAAIAKAEGGQ